jgi:hypothetical protein
LHLDEAFAFRFPVRDDKPDHTRDLRKLLRFMARVQRRAWDVSSAPTSCARCGEPLRSKDARCGQCGRWRDVRGQLRAEDFVLGWEITSAEIERIPLDEPWHEMFGGGLAASSVTVIGSRPGRGKSSLCLMVAAQIAGARQARPVRRRRAGAR